MERIKFIRDTVPEKEGGPGYKLGDVVELPRALCERWRRRDAAEYVADTPPKIEESHGDTLDGPADVGGDDGGGDGQRAEPESGADQPRPRGRPAKHRG